LSEEKRHYQRIRFREPLQYWLPKKPHVMGTITSDIGPGGVCFSSEEFIPLHSEVNFSVGLRPERHVDILGRVAWVQQIPHAERYQIGVEFEDSPFVQMLRKEIDQLIKLYKPI
jgi:hypothetical protein